MRTFRFFTLFILFLVQSSFSFAGFEIVWTGEQSGVITFSPDKYSDAPYQVRFKDQNFIERQEVTYFSDGRKAVQNFGECIINRSCSQSTLSSFAHATGVTALKEKYLIP